MNTAVSKKVQEALGASLASLPAANISIELPGFREAQPEVLPDNSAYMLIGQPKGGKSKFAEHVSRSRMARGMKPLLHIDTENGCHNLAGAILPVTNLSEFERVVILCESHRERYSGYVIDTGDMLNEWCEQKACSILGIKAMGEGAYGADWSKARSIFMEYFMRFKSLHQDIWVICHTKTDKQNEVSQLRPNLPKGLSEALMGQCDSIAYISTEKIKGVTARGERIPEHYERYISFAGHEGMTSGTRWDATNGRKFALADLKEHKEANLFAPIVDAFVNNTSSTNPTIEETKTNE